MNAMTVSIQATYQKKELWRRWLTLLGGHIGGRTQLNTVVLVTDARKPTKPLNKNLVYFRR
jgi:GTP-binding protein EngB required for normal cell division